YDIGVHALSLRRHYPDQVRRSEADPPPSQPARAPVAVHLSVTRGSMGAMTDLRERLAAARLYLCTGGRRRQGDLAEFLDAVLAGGVDIVQLREKGLEAGEELALLEVFADACRRHGRLLAVNDRADVALAASADVLHLGQDDLPVPVARQILGPGPVIGRSSHSPAH